MFIFLVPFLNAVLLITDLFPLFFPFLRCHSSCSRSSKTSCCHGREICNITPPIRKSVVIIRREEWFRNWSNSNLQRLNNQGSSVTSNITNEQPNRQGNQVETIIDNVVDVFCCVSVDGAICKHDAEHAKRSEENNLGQDHRDTKNRKNQEIVGISSVLVTIGDLSSAEISQEGTEVVPNLEDVLGNGVFRIRPEGNIFNIVDVVDDGGEHGNAEHVSAESEAVVSDTREPLTPSEEIFLELDDVVMGSFILNIRKTINEETKTEDVANSNEEVRETLQPLNVGSNSKDDVETNTDTVETDWDTEDSPRLGAVAKRRETRENVTFESTNTNTSKEIGDECPHQTL